MSTGKNSRMYSRQLAVCGMMCGLGELFLLAGVLPMAEYCSPVLAMLPQLPVVEAWGQRPALGVYAATGLLGLFLAFHPEAVLVYLCLGYYPALRPALQRLPVRRRKMAKLLVFCCAASGISAGTLLLLRPTGWGEAVSLPLFGLLLILGGAVFVLLDLALERLQRAYGSRWRKWLLR